MSETGSKSVALISGNAEYQEASLEPSPEVMKLWKKVHNDMRSEFGEAIFRSWLKPLKLQAFYHGTMEVSVPTRFMRDWIQNHYAERSVAMCIEASEGAAEEIKRLQIVVVQNAIIDDSEELAPQKANQNQKIDISQISKQLRDNCLFPENDELETLKD